MEKKSVFTHTKMRYNQKNLLRIFSSSSFVVIENFNVKHYFLSCILKVYILLVYSKFKGENDREKI